MGAQLSTYDVPAAKAVETEEAKNSTLPIKNQQKDASSVIFYKFVAST